MRRSSIPHRPLATLSFCRAFLCAFAVTWLASYAGARDLGVSDSVLEIAHSVFPGANKYQPELRVISLSRAKEIAALLPTGVRNRELGKRVVYSVFNGDNPLGLIHIRNELGDWGAMEIAWHLNLDLTIRDFTLLRCREPERVALEASGFRDLIVSKGIRSLGTLLEDSENDTFSDDTRALARTLIASAIKSLATTQVGWPLTRSKLRMRKAAVLRFPRAHAIAFREVASSPGILTALNACGFHEIGPAQRSSFLLAEAVDENGKTLGSLVHVRVSLDEQTLPLLLTVTDGTLKGANALEALQQESLQAELAGLEGQRAEDLVDSRSPIDNAAAIALCIAEYWGEFDGK